MTLFIAEDEALKMQLTGIRVTDANSAARPVKVYFRLPEAEERRVDYPFITIDFIDIVEDTERAHRGYINLGYEPHGVEPAPEGFTLASEFPVPVRLIYQVTSYTRSAQHDRQIMGNLMAGRIPIRFGQIHVPADGTTRRLDFLGVDQADGLDRNNKRVFRKAFTVAIPSEIFPAAIDLVQQAAMVSTTIYHQLEPYLVNEE